METLTLIPSTTPVNGVVTIPGSKSYTNRALLTAALAHGTSRLSAASLSSDCEAMIAGLRALGFTIHEPRGGTLLVEGRGGNLPPSSVTIDVGPAGTTMRFLTALCAGIPGADITLCGSERLHSRPIGDLVEALRAAGASIDYLGTTGCPPLRINSSRRLRGGPISIDGSTSSQFISALLLSAPLFTDGLTLTVTGSQVSTSYLDMTLQSVSDFGLSVTHENYSHFRVAPGQSFQSRQYMVEGDASGASYLWAMAAVTQGRVTVENVNPLSAQGDMEFPNLLARMGCDVTSTTRSITVQGSPELQPIEADMSLMPDTAQTLAVIAACAAGTSVLRGLQTLSAKETDRLAALHMELAKMGVRTEVGPDYIVIHGGTPRGARIATYEDHRMAMSFAVLGARVPNIEIEEPRVVEKSFPNFWDTLTSLGVRSTVNHS